MFTWAQNLRLFDMPTPGMSNEICPCDLIAFFPFGRVVDSVSKYVHVSNTYELYLQMPSLCALFCFMPS